MAVNGGNRFGNIAEKVDDDANGWPALGNTTLANGKSKKPLGTMVIRDEKARHPAPAAPRLEPKHNISKLPTPVPSSQPEEGKRLDKKYTYYCAVCRIKFPNNDAFQTHLTTLPGHGFYCHLCKRIFKVWHALSDHLNNTAGHEIFCNLCLNAFESYEDLRAHMENKGFGGHEHACLTCFEAFKNAKALERHFWTSEAHVYCSTCDRMFRGQVQRDEHWAKTAKHKHCLHPGCKFDGPDSAALEKHMKACHSSKGGKTVLLGGTKDRCEACDACTATFPDKNSLLVHQMRSCFTCSECGIWTNLKEDYLQHVAEAHGYYQAGAPGVHKCVLCAIPKETLSGIIKHIETGKCPKLPKPDYLLQLLGKWWYSVLYMDIDIHVQIREGRLDTMGELMKWINDGAVHPYICRADGCGKTFDRFCAMVHHIEAGLCKWGMEMLRLDLFEKELIRVAKQDGLV